ncbi:oxidoreductase [Gemmatimonadetes bacterium T265]|nr:oxidoreductase [Gemmatimonadetes bacterium T265]
MKIDGNTVLITGGTSGIGAALAQRLRDVGNHVIVAGRRQDALDKVVRAQERMSGLVLDVADPDSIRAAADQVVRDHPALNVLVNMAGIMKFEDATSKRSLDDAEATIATNLMGPIRMTDALIDQLTGAANAAIINVSSGLGFVPLTTTPTYSASKAAIHFYTVALREQLRGKVEVIELVPPAVATELTPGQSKRPGYMPLSEFIDEVMELLGRQPTPPELLVERVAMQRFAERENRFDATLKKMNEMAAAARAQAGG